MRGAMIGLMAATVLLAGCKIKAGKEGEDGNTTSISISTGEEAVKDRQPSGLSIDAPGFKAKIDIDGLKLGGDSMEIDGMTLYPGTKVARIAVGDGGAGSEDQVDMGFTSPGTPDQIAAHYAAQARAADYTAIKSTRRGTGAVFTATKPDGGNVTIDIAPAKDGSTGKIVLRDGKV